MLSVQMGGVGLIHHNSTIAEVLGHVYEKKLTWDVLCVQMGGAGLIHYNSTIADVLGHECETKLTRDGLGVCRWVA
jgi:hypothetical protein